jgi:hypothetical protein
MGLSRHVTWIVSAICSPQCVRHAVLLELHTEKPDHVRTVTKIQRESVDRNLKRGDVEVRGVVVEGDDG